MSARVLAAALLLAALPLLITRAAPPDGKSWPTFRGEGRTAVSPDTGLLTKWPAEGPKLVWETDGAGRGYSSLAIAGGKIYTLGDAPTGADDKDEYLICFDQASGKPQWKTKTGPAWTSGQANWQSSRCTPTVDGERVYALTAQGVLICCETNGGELWRKDLKKDFGGSKADGWGYSESPLVDGNRLVITPGGAKNTMVALDKTSGALLWSCPRPGDRGAAHASIVPADVGGIRVYVQVSGSGAMGVNAADGKLLWSYEIERTTAIAPSPIIRGDLVFFTAGYGRGGALLKQVPVDGGVKVEEIYGINPALANKHGGVVLVGDHLYGDSDDRGIPWCAELMTGKVLWKSRGSGRNSASVAAADGHIYIRYASGQMTLVKANPERLEEVGSFTVPGSGPRPSWSHPVILEGKLYLREGDKVLCYDLRA